ncbi:hypothetical protein AB0C04_28965 [Micromonospora sp. NPDC048909]
MADVEEVEGGEVDAAAHAAGVGLDLPIGRVTEADPFHDPVVRVSA